MDIKPIMAAQHDPLGDENNGTQISPIISDENVQHVANTRDEEEVKNMENELSTDIKDNSLEIQHDEDEKLCKARRKLKRCAMYKSFDEVGIEPLDLEQDLAELLQPKPIATTYSESQTSPQANTDDFPNQPASETCRDSPEDPPTECDGQISKPAQTNEDLSPLCDDMHNVNRFSGQQSADLQSVTEDGEDDEDDLNTSHQTFSYVYKKDSWKKKGKEKGESSKRRASPPEASQRFTGDVSSEMSDMGPYAFFTLVAVSLYKLYENEPCDRDFKDETLRTLGEHLKLSTGLIKAGFAIAEGDGTNDAQIFVKSLRGEAVVKLHGKEVLLCDFMSLNIRQGVYDCRIRTLLRYVSEVMMVDWERIVVHENLMVEKFLEEEHSMTEEEKKERDAKKRNRMIKKAAMLGVGAVVGGAALGLTGGLAAPLIAAGVGAVTGGVGAAALGSTAGVFVIGSLFGAAGAGLTGYKMNKRVGDLEEFIIEDLTEGQELDITLAVSGWLTEENQDFGTAWQCLNNSGEQYVLRYESKYLTQVGSAMETFMKMAIKSAGLEALKRTALAGLISAMTLPAAVVSASSVIDNPWGVSMSRSALAGKELANVLLARQQGKRPVTLIGFSLGARVIYHCLQEMAESTNCEGIVEKAILLGAPVPSTAEDWKKMRRVVSGRIINGYCRSDWLLKFLYLPTSVSSSSAGLGPIDWDDRRMHNIDLTDYVAGHMDYMDKLNDILDVIHVKTKPPPGSSEESSEESKIPRNGTLRSLSNRSDPGVSRSVTTTSDDPDIPDELTPDDQYSDALNEPADEIFTNES